MENQIALITKYETIILGLIGELRQIAKRDEINKTAIRDVVNRYSRLANIKVETREYTRKADIINDEDYWIKARDERKAKEYSEEVDNLAELSRKLRDKSSEYEYDESKIANNINEQPSKANEDN